MHVDLFTYPIQQGPRVPQAKQVVEVVATLPANEVGAAGAVLMGAHFDTIHMGADPLTANAPGANDDASGIAATLGVAKALAETRHSHPLIFCAFSGEEQGLFGSAALAAKFQQDGLPIQALLSNDMIGNSKNLAGQSDDHQVRVFSEEKAGHESRELARWLEWLQRSFGDRNLAIKLVFRADRFGRGGDHTPFNQRGFTAIRLVEMHEEYSRQHTEKDLPQSMDFHYLSKIAHLNLLALRSLGSAGPQPTEVRVDRRQNHDTLLTWKSQPGVNYRVYWRDTTEPTWTHSVKIGSLSKKQFKMVSKDENVFAVGAEGGIPVVAN